MSHSISVTCTTCHSTTFDTSITSNLSPMFRAAGLDLTDSQWQGQPGIVLLPTLQRAIDNLESDPDRYREMNPENGWGDYDGGLQTLRHLRDCIARTPDAIYRDHF